MIRWEAVTFVAGLAIGIAGAISVSPKPSHARIDTLIVRVAQADTVRVRDSIRVIHTVHALDTVRQTVLDHLTDTLTVKEFVYKTDTLRAACLACTASASRFKKATDSLNAANAQLIRQLERKSRWQTVLPIATGIGGFLLGAKLRP